MAGKYDLGTYLSYNYDQLRINEFRNMVSILPRALRGSTNAPYVEFVIDGTTFATYTNQDYFMQMSCTYAGIGNDPNSMFGGEGNKFSIQLAYMPTPSQDPNFIDELLAGVTADNKLCTLTFGYTGIPQYNMRSSTYDCLITGYSLTIQNNYMYYTIECVSQGLIFREQRFTFLQQRGVDDAINFIYQCWSACGVNEYYNLHIDKDAYGHVAEMDIGYNYDDNDELIDNTNTLADITVFQFLSTILQNIKDVDDDHAVYWYELSDVSGKKTILIHRTLVTSEEDVTGMASFTFDWGGNHQDDSTNNLILGFEADYKGEVNIAVSDKLIEDKYVIKNSGIEAKFPGYYDYLVPDAAKQDYSATARFWDRATTWSYTAQIELQGIPADIPVGAYIEINPLIYGRKHHTSGLYCITGARCDISANGFRTNLSLVKIIVNGNTDWYKKQRQQVVWEYVNFLNNLYVNSSGTLSVRNDPTDWSTPTTSGKDYVVIYNDPNDPVQQAAKAKSQSYYEELTSALPASREG